MNKPVVNARLDKTRSLTAESSGDAIVIGPPVTFSGQVSRKLQIQQSFAIEDRRSWTDMWITVITGRCRIEMRDGEFVLEEHSQHKIPANHEHSIVALTDFRAVITLQADSACSE